jgi:hypothetical protein
MASREENMVVIAKDDEGNPTIWCDPEIADIVTALNAGELSTVASCSGHGYRPGRISLKDGRELFIATKEQAEVIDAAFPTDINGQDRFIEAHLKGHEFMMGILPNLYDDGLIDSLSSPQPTIQEPRTNLPKSAFDPYDTIEQQDFIQKGK